MNKLKLGLIYLQSKSGLEKNMLKILCAPCHDIPLEEHIKPIVQELKDLDRTSSGREKVSIFVKKLESLKSWEQALKLLLVSHRAILAESNTFLTEFKLHAYKNIQEFPNQIKELKLYVRCVLTKHYYNYLKTFSEHYFAISKALAINRQINYTPQIDLITLENYGELKKLLTLAFKMEDILTASLEVIELPLVKEVGRMILADAIELYNALNAYVSAAIPEIFTLDEETSLKLDEHYSDLIKMTRRMIDFDQMKHNFNKSREIEEPQIFNFDPVFNKKEELYVNEIRKRRRFQRSEIAPSLKTGRHVSAEDSTKALENLEKLNKNHEIPIKEESNILATEYFYEEEQPEKGKKYANLLQQTDKIEEIERKDSNGNPLYYQNDSSIENGSKGGLSYQKINFIPKKKINSEFKTLVAPLPSMKLSQKYNDFEKF